jgi:hypothetical protein
VIGNVTYNGQRGIVASSVNVTVRNTGAAKRVYYVEGAGYDMGYLMGMLSEHDASLMSTLYIERIIPELIIPNLDRKWRNSTLYEDLLKVIGFMLCQGSIKSFDELNAQSFFPTNLVDEMHGMADGCKAVNPNTNVTFETVVTLNYGFDYLLAHVYTGHFISKLREVSPQVLSVERSTTLWKAIDGMISRDEKLFKFPIFCDAFGAGKDATTTGKGAIFARDFQLPTGDIFQDINTMVILNPNDGRIPSIITTAPGIVGGVTAMNAAGVSMGVDVLRSGASNHTAPGLGSCLLVRHVTDYAKSANDVKQLIKDAKRGTTWLYPSCDGAGECLIVEAGRYSTTPEMPLDLIKNTELLSLLPDAAYVLQNNADEYFFNGAYIRDFSYSYPMGYLGYNPKLWSHFGYNYNVSAGTSPTGELFSSWQKEDNATKHLTASYFTPLRADPSKPHMIVTSNVAVVPEMRISQMAPWAELIQGTAHAVQWRYDTLNSLVNQHYGSIDFDTAKFIITFLSPDRTPGYWARRLDPNDPMSAVIEGSISVVDTTTKRIATKAGYWSDGWIELTLTRYID